MKPPEATPGQPNMVDTQFETLFREVSGLGDALQVEVNHRALQRAVTDSGLNGRVSFTFGVSEDDNNARVEITHGNKQFGAIIDRNSPELADKEKAEATLQFLILVSLARLALKDPHADPRNLIMNMEAERHQNLKRKAKIFGGFVLGCATSETIIETAAASSPSTLKLATVVAFGVALGQEVRRRIQPYQAPDKRCIRGYPPIIEFHADQSAAQ